jgi:MSHA biogenesis protein MshL
MHAMNKSIELALSLPTGRLHWVFGLLGTAALTMLAGCATGSNVRPALAQTVDELVPAAPVAARAPVPSRISDALIEPVAPAAVPEPRIDLLVNNAPARDVFLAMVADSRYSMLMHPDVAGNISVTLRGVTVPEALDAIRDVYGFDYKMDGRRITVYAPTLQTRIFTVNYPNSQRQGTSEVRVSAGAITSAGGTGQTGGSSSSNNGSGSSGSSSQQSESSHVATKSQSDLWQELTNVVRGMVGSVNGRSVHASPQAGILAVRAMPDELAQVDKFLKAAKIAVERQVMLEAKIVEVELREGFQSGVDWSGFRTAGKTTGVIGSSAGNAGNWLTNASSGANVPNLPAFSGTANTTGLSDQVALPSGGTGLFGLALATTGFQAVLGFLETHGDVQILSSPRIATLNNQKAVLKVGTDEFYVTGVTGGSNNNSTSNTSGTTNTLPSLTLSSFFSGIALDVTPQIDDENSITLHVHPSVTAVTEKSKQIDLGSVGNYRLPLASSSVNESDTLVRLQDGHIVAIGGLMQVQSNRSNSGLPGSTDVPLFSSIFGNKQHTSHKREVIVLIKPSIIRNAHDWEVQTQRARGALQDIDSGQHRVISMQGVAPPTAVSPVKP